jgi:hypothetical protein
VRRARWCVGWGACARLLAGPLDRKALGAAGHVAIPSGSRLRAKTGPTQWPRGALAQEAAAYGEVACAVIDVPRRMLQLCRTCRPRRSRPHPCCRSHPPRPPPPGPRARA